MKPFTQLTCQHNISKNLVPTNFFFNITNVNSEPVNLFSSLKTPVYVAIIEGTNAKDKDDIRSVITLHFQVVIDFHINH